MISVVPHNPSKYTGIVLVGQADVVRSKWQFEEVV